MSTFYKVHTLKTSVDGGDVKTNLAYLKELFSAVIQIDRVKNLDAAAAIETFGATAPSLLRALPEVDRSMWCGKSVAIEGRYVEQSTELYRNKMTLS